MNPAQFHIDIGPREATQRLFSLCAKARIADGIYADKPDRTDKEQQKSHQADDRYHKPVAQAPPPLETSRPVAIGRLHGRICPVSRQVSPPEADFLVIALIWCQRRTGSLYELSCRSRWTNPAEPLYLCSLAWEPLPVVFPRFHCAQQLVR